MPEEKKKLLNIMGNINSLRTIIMKIPNCKFYYLRTRILVQSIVFVILLFCMLPIKWHTVSFAKSSIEYDVSKIYTWQFNRYNNQNPCVATVYKQIPIDTKLKTRKRIQETEMTGKAHQEDEVPHWTWRQWFPQSWCKDRTGRVTSIWIS